MTPEQIQGLATLPLQVLLMIAVGVLWRAHDKAQNARLDDLKQLYRESLGDLRLRVHLLEDNAGMPHPVALKTDEKPVLSKFPTKDSKLD